MGVQIELLTDLLTGTLANYAQDEVQYALSKPDWEFVNRWFREDKVTKDGGDQVEFYVQLKRSNNATRTRLYDADTVQRANVVQKGHVKWVHAKTGYCYDIREIMMNKANPNRIFNILTAALKASALDLAEQIESDALYTPESSTDDLRPHGLSAWLCQADADSANGFTAYVPDYTVAAGATQSAYSTLGGLACTSTTNPLWASRYADHDDKLDDTFLGLLFECFLDTNFQTPKVADQAIDPDSSFSNFRYYTCKNVLKEMEKILRKSDDKIGFDLGKYAGNIVYKNIPMIYISKLDTDYKYVYGGNPFWGVNHEHFHVAVLADNNFRVTPAEKSKDSHNVYEGWIDLTYAIYDDNRRTSGFLLSDWESGN